MGFGLVNAFIDHLYTPLATTSNYSAITNLHTLQITTAPTKPFSSLMCLHQPFPGNSFWQWRFFSFVHSGSNFTASHAELCQLTINCQPSVDWIAPVVFFITPWHGPHRKHHSSIVVSVSMGTCLRSHCSETTVLPHLFIISSYFYANPMCDYLKCINNLFANINSETNKIYHFQDLYQLYFNYNYNIINTNYFN
jgi:hypothetical protein